MLIPVQQSIIRRNVMVTADRYAFILAVGHERHYHHDTSDLIRHLAGLGFEIPKRLSHLHWRLQRMLAIAEDAADYPAGLLELHVGDEWKVARYAGAWWPSQRWSRTTNEWEALLHCRIFPEALAHLVRIRVRQTPNARRYHEFVAYLDEIENDLVRALQSLRQEQVA